MSERTMDGLAAARARGRTGGQKPKKIGRKGLVMIDFENRDMWRALVERDISRVFQLLVDSGMAQRKVAELVGMSQSEVSEILSGRRVMAYDVFSELLMVLRCRAG